MQTYPAFLTRREYRLKPWLRSFLLIGSAALGFPSFYLLFFLSSRFTLGGSLTLVLPLAVMAVYLALVGLRSQLSIDGSRITVCNGIITRSADLADIQGFRSIATRNASDIRIYLKNGLPAITMSRSFDTDEDFRTWFKQIPDLDERDRDQLLSEIAEQRDLGATPEERLAALAAAGRTNIIILLITLAAAVFLNLGGNLPIIEIPSAILLAFVPMGVAVLMHRAPLLYVIFKRKSDPRAEISFPLLAAGIAFVIRNRNLHLVSMRPLALLVAFLAIAYSITFFRSVLTSTSRFGAFIGLLFFVLPYCFAVPMTADTLIDPSPTTIYAAPVIRKHVSSGRSTSYFLDLGPWGPMQQNNRISVSRSAYDTFSPGDQVCLALHAGRLHAPWYTQVSCTFAPDLTR